MSEAKQMMNDLFGSEKLPAEAAIELVKVVATEMRAERLARAESSEETDKLDAALAKAQAEIRGAVKDSQNPHFRSQYADLFAVSEACREALSKNGIAVSQLPRKIDGKPHIVTRLAHAGQWLRGEYEIRPTKDDPQGVGSAITYARRYSLAAMAGVAPRGDDDDGNAASNVGGSTKGEPKRGSWGDLQGGEPPQQDAEKPKRQAPVELADVPDDIDRLPADVAKLQRELERFADVPFANMKDGELQAIARAVDKLAARASSPKNKLVLTAVAAVAQREYGKRVAGGGAQTGAQQ